jgi:hypothetical protein
LGLGRQHLSVLLTGRADAAVIVEVAFIFHIVAECRLILARQGVQLGGDAPRRTAYECLNGVGQDDRLYLLTLEI